MYMTLNKLYNLHNLPLQACPWELCICNLFQSLCRASECTADSTGFHSPVFSIWQSDSCLHNPLWCNNHKALRMKIISHNSHRNKHYKTAPHHHTSTDGLPLVEKIENVTAALVMKSEDWPQRLNLTFALMRLGFSCEITASVLMAS